MREHTGLEFVNGKLYLYGGLSHKILSDFYMLDPGFYLFFINSNII